MATVTKVLCDLCGGEGHIRPGVNVPVLVDSTASEYGTKKLPSSTIETRKIDLCEECLRKITRLHEIPKWYAGSEYELIEVGE